MTNYLEEKADKDCAFEGLQGSLLLVKISTFIQYRQTRGFCFFPPFNSFSWEKKKKKDSID